MSIDITNIIITLIGLLLTVITAVVVPWLRTKFTANQIDIIRQLATVAVYAAQQLYTSEQAQEKKDYAIEYIKAELEKYKIVFSEEAISAYIEGTLKNIKGTEGERW